MKALSSDVWGFLFLILPHGPGVLIQNLFFLKSTTGTSLRLFEKKLDRPVGKSRDTLLNQNIHPVQNGITWIDIYWFDYVLKEQYEYRSKL